MMWEGSKSIHFRVEKDELLDLQGELEGIMISVCKRA